MNSHVLPHLHLLLKKHEVQQLESKHNPGADFNLSSRWLCAYIFGYTQAYTLLHAHTHKHSSSQALVCSLAHLVETQVS